MRTIDTNSKQLLVNLFYRIGTFYHEYGGSDKKGRIKYFFAQLRRIEFDIWEKVIKENKKFDLVTMSLPTRDPNQPMTLELSEDFLINSENIRGYTLLIRRGKKYFLELHLFSCLTDPANESKGRTWHARANSYGSGNHPNEMKIEIDGSTDEDDISYEEEFVDNVLKLFLTELLIPAKI